MSSFNTETKLHVFGGLTEDQRAQAQELAQWWADKADAEIDQTVAKAVEYGADDLRDIGHDLADIADRKVSHEEAVELGIYFYLRGKMSRWTSAIRRGERPSDDTLLDIGVYSRMAQRNRQVGGWPNNPEPVKDDEIPM